MHHLLHILNSGAKVGLGVVTFAGWKSAKFAWLERVGSPFRFAEMLLPPVLESQVKLVEGIQHKRTKESDFANEARESSSCVSASREPENEYFIARRPVGGEEVVRLADVLG